MQIFLPGSPDYVRSVGPGGYKREKTTINTNKLIDKFNFYIITVPKGEKASGHYHADSHELFYSLTQMKVKLNNEWYDLPIGTLVIANPGDSHEFDVREQETKYLAIKIPSNEEDKIMI